MCSFTERHYIPRRIKPATLVLAAPWCIFYATRYQTYWRFDKNDMIFTSTLIWYDTHRQIHTGHTRTNILAHT